MASSQKLINDPNDVVTELIQGLVETQPELQYLNGFPEVKVVLRADVSKGIYDKVAIISGGGSGHEPAHAGFVGNGMLTAAVCGDVFASPSVTAVLSAIRAVTGPAGCLLIIKNYTGDRLNFGLAAEQAKAEGYKVEMVIVGDDCALPPPRGIAGRRGLAGTLFVHKVAGAAAAAGLSLSEVAAEAAKVATSVGTMGVGLSVCTLPGQPPSARLEAGKMELGLGIHGEPGAVVVDIQPANSVVKHLLKQILSPETGYMSIKRGSRVALMVNGLGATPGMELMIISGKAIAQLQIDYGLSVERVYTGNFMTSLDMKGFSLSILNVDDLILSRLDAPTRAPGWPVGVDVPRPQNTIPIDLPKAPDTANVIPSRPEELTAEGKVLEAAIHAGATAVAGMRDMLNEWDGKVGDGDCGSTMYKGANAILEDLRKHYPLNDAAATVNEIGLTIQRVMGGTSGVIYDIICKAAYASLKEKGTKLSAKDWANALDGAVSAVSKYGGASVGYRTLLDALIPASSCLQEKLKAGEDGVKAFLNASEVGYASAEATKDLRPQAGRSSYITADVVLTVPDPGAMAAAAWFREAAIAVAKSHKVL